MTGNHVAGNGRHNHTNHVTGNGGTFGHQIVHSSTHTFNLDDTWPEDDNDADFVV